MLFRCWVWTKKITEWYKKCGERTRNFLWMKKSGVGGTSAEVTLNWDHGSRMRDQGWRSRCCTPMQSLPESSNGIANLLHRKAPSNWLYCYVGIYLLINEPVSCAVGIWHHVFEANISEWWENWKGSKLRPSAAMKGTAAVPNGREGPRGHRGWRGLGK